MSSKDVPSLLCKDNHNNATNSTPENLTSCRSNAEISSRKSKRLRNYDFNISTEDNYSSDEDPFVGKYANYRSMLDYSYHKHYSCKRQQMHDIMIDLFLNTVVRDKANNLVCECPIQPWLVFTAGVMGAGKGYTIKWLYNKELFPLDSFVTVDPDSLRELLPETKEYIQRDPYTAGMLTQKEAGYIAEVLTIDALELGKNILVDGSLRDADWFITYIQQIQSKYPKLKIAIIYVTAPEETILSRVRQRAELTGRLVPEDIILDTLRKLPNSISRLTPFVDFVAAFRNENDEEPRLLYMQNNCKNEIKASEINSYLFISNESKSIPDKKCNRTSWDGWEEEFKKNFLMECSIGSFSKTTNSETVEDHNKGEVCPVSFWL